MILLSPEIGALMAVPSGPVFFAGFVLLEIPPAGAAVFALVPTTARRVRRTPRPRARGPPSFMISSRDWSSLPEAISVAVLNEVGKRLRMNAGFAIKCPALRGKAC